MSKPLVFYVKWAGTFGSLLTVALTSFDVVPYNKYSGLATALLWMTSGILWEEAALTIPNLIISVIYFIGIIK
jgi:hypothetical protein